MQTAAFGTALVPDVGDLRDLYGLPFPCSYRVPKMPDSRASSQPVQP